MHPRALVQDDSGGEEADTGGYGSQPRAGVAAAMPYRDLDEDAARSGDQGAGPQADIRPDNAASERQRRRTAILSHINTASQLTAEACKTKNDMQ